MTPIHFHLYDMSGPHIFFKPKANDRAKVFTIHCSNEDCQLRKQGQCMFKPTLGWTKCPYGRYNEIQGPTRRAKNFHTWCGQQRQAFAGVPYMKEPAKKIAVVGDYIYLPYAHVDMNPNVPFLSQGGFMSNGQRLIKKEDWTVENVYKIVTFYPQALFGGTITSYQSEEVPLFLQHLEEVMPTMYAQLIDLHPELIERYKLNNKDYVGRTAILKTVKPCTFTTEGYQGRYHVTWVWDGVVAKSTSEYAYYESWAKLKDGEHEVIYKPSDKTVIKITDNAQVGPETVFVD